MLSIFGVTIVVYFIKILSGSCNFWSHLRTTDPSLHTAATTFQKFYFKTKKTELNIKFLVRCCNENITPKFVRWKNLKSKYLIPFKVDKTFFICLISKFTLYFITDHTFTYIALDNYTYSIQ